MSQRLPIAAILFSLFLLTQSQPARLWGAPSFDCDKASSSVEIVICGDTQLSDYDREMAALYREARAASKNKDQLTAQQRAWVKSRNQACGQGREAVKCLRTKYEERIGQLRELVPAARRSETGLDITGVYQWNEDGSQAEVIITKIGNRYALDLAFMGENTFTCNFSGSVGAPEAAKAINNGLTVPFADPDPDEASGLMRVSFDGDTLIIRSLSSKRDPHESVHSLYCGLRAFIPFDAYLRKVR